MSMHSKNEFKGVNYTGSLDIIRTSPDHGTAYDMVNTNKANTKSLYLEMTETASMEPNKYISPYSPNTDDDRRKMLSDIGVDSSEFLTGMPA